MLWWLEGFTHLMMSNVLICIFWPRGECHTFWLELANFEAREKKFVRACPQPKLENYESDDHRLQYYRIKKVGKNFISWALSVRRWHNFNLIRFYNKLNQYGFLQVGDSGLYTSQVAHQAAAYPGFCSMKWIGVFLLPVDGMLVHRRVTPQH